MYDICTICKITQYVPNMYIKSVCFSAFILHISGTDRYKISVRYIIFQPVIRARKYWKDFRNILRA
jgi:hypothetical protein